MREIMQLMQTAIDWTDELPIGSDAVQQAITIARDNYRSAVDAKDWEKLARVYHSKTLPNEDDYRNLLFNRCVLEYRSAADAEEYGRWHDVHPLLVKIEEFQAAYGGIQSS